MQTLTDHGEAVLANLSQNFGLGRDAVRAMMDAVSNGGGSQAQFNIPELGGMGQWQQGGMIMVGDMFNTGLQARVADLCGQISHAYYQGSFYPPPPKGSLAGGQWWPPELGHASSTGMQNTQGYAIFPQTARLAILRDGAVRVYDTGQHMIGGVGQQQSVDGSVTFTSQFGTVRVEELAMVSGPETEVAPAQPVARVEAAQAVAPEPPSHAPDSSPEHSNQQLSTDVDAIYDAITKLGSLHDLGILTDDEFSAKKAELLARI